MAEVMATMRRVYQQEAEMSIARRHAPPPAAATLRKIHAAVGAKVRGEARALRRP